MIGHDYQIALILPPRRTKMFRLTTLLGLLISLTFAAIPGLSSSGRPSDGQILEEALVHGEAFHNLQHITDTIGPRLTGSDNLERAAAYAIEKLKAYGLSNVHREEWQLPSTWERGRCSVMLVEPSSRQLTAASMGWNRPTAPGGVSGEVINISAAT